MLTKVLTKRLFWTEKGLTRFELTPCNYLVPEARVELARAQGPPDFESGASTSFTTPAFQQIDYIEAYFSMSTHIRAAHSA